jgi:hypothetical protein
MIKSPLVKIFTVKALGIVATCGTAGGVAIAACTGAFNGSAHAVLSSHSPAASAASGTVSSVTDHTGVATAAGSAGATDHGTVPAVTVTRLADLCYEVASHAAALAGQATAAVQAHTPAAVEQVLATSQAGQVLNSPAFASLTSAADAVPYVPDYCAILLSLPQFPEPGLVSALPSRVLAGLPADLVAKLPVPMLAQLPVWYLAKLPVHVLAGLPSSVLAKLPAPVLAELPLPVLAKLPVPTVAALPLPVIAKLPIPVIGELPVPVIDKLPVPVIAELPVPVIDKLPVPVLSQLPVPVLSRLPIPVLSTCPPSVLAKLPTGVLSKLPAPVQAGLPSSVLHKLGLS